MIDLDKICVLGLGYIGLPTALLFATNNATVVGVDINEEVIAKLNKGEIHFEEKGLLELFEKARKSKTFTASKEIPEADVFIICAPTPWIKNIM